MTILHGGAASNHGKVKEVKTYGRGHDNKPNTAANPEIKTSENGKIKWYREKDIKKA